MNKVNSDYYEARGFGTYYLCNAVHNIITDSMSYIRGIEDALGDMRTLNLMLAFPRATNLHDFIREIASQVLTAEVQKPDAGFAFIKKFLEIYCVSVPDDVWADEDSFWEFAGESERFHKALDEITDEVFHVLFNDVGFLHAFNKICAEYIEISGFDSEHRTRAGTLRRVSIPIWARRAIYHRDKGECRSCKRSLAAVINRLETERYDHIVPLARFGANDVTNLQLLCEPCNSAKAAKKLPVSTKYQRAFKAL